MSIVVSREQRRQLERENAKRPLHLEGIPRDEWPASMAVRSAAPFAAWRSRHFFVQAFKESGPVVCRLSILRTTLDGDRWADGISWDDLQRLKREAGYGDCDAVEVYPPDADVVNVANIRHLWVMSEPLAFRWRRA